MTAPRPLSDTYLDSSVLVDAMFAGLPHFAVSDAFCAQLADNGSHVYVSHLAYLEVGEAVRRLATRQQLPAIFRAEFHLADWATSANVRKQWMSFGRQEMERLLDRFSEAYEILFQHSLWLQSIDLIGQYGLRASDAAHVATALHAGLRVFATNDDDFRRVTMLDVVIVRDGYGVNTARKAS